VEVQFKCPCGEVLSAHEQDINETIACHKCGRVLVVPGVPVAAGIGGQHDHGGMQEAGEVVEAATRSWVASHPAAAERPAAVSGMAVASLVLGVVGPFLSILSIVAGILAIVFGVVALRATSSSPPVRGRGMAIAGIMLGTVDMLLGGAFLLAIFGTGAPEDSLDVICNLVSLLY